MKSLIALVAALAAALFLSSCTTQTATSGDGHTDHQHGDDNSYPGQPAANNAADVAFATDMIPHHQQAVELAALVPDRSSDPAVVELAAAISAEQTPEILTMKAFLAQWGADTSGGDAGHDPGMEMTPGTDTGGAPMQGMVDGPTMTKLQSLKGAEFDQLWLQSMIGHHQGAIQMANTEIADGTNADAKTLAQKIVAAQTAEIAQMKKMLGG